jgi:hypothetical protein
MALAVVTVASGGLPVVDVTATSPKLGLPVTEAMRGVPVTKVAAGKPGMPTTFVTATGGPIATGDPDWLNVVLLIPASGADGATAVPDASPIARGNGTILGTGGGAAGTVELDTAQFLFGSSSLLSSKLTGAYRGEINWGYSANLAAAAFCIESFARFSSVTPPQTLMGSWSDAGSLLSWVVFLHTDGKLYLTVSTTGSDAINVVSGTWNPIINTWYYIRIDFNGTTYRAYMGLASDTTAPMIGSSTTVRTIFNGTRPLALLGGNNNQPFLGWMCPTRVTLGTARSPSDAGVPVPKASFPIGP